jgi:putative PIN family toxin of toxin-antitoxin system
MQAKPRVVLDTNIFISGLISRTGAPHELLALWEQDEIILLTSSE